MTITTELPAFRVCLDEVPLVVEYESALESVVVDQVLCQPSCCELTFSLAGGVSVDISIGTKVSIVLDLDSSHLFGGEVTACRYHYGFSGQQQLIVRCYDALHRLRKRQKLRQFDEIDLSSLVENIVSDLGVAVEFHGDDIFLPQVLQWRQSDLALLTQSVQKYGQYFSLWDDVLHVFPAQGVEQSVALRWGENLLSVDVELNAEPACRTVAVMGWDPHRAESITGEAGMSGGFSYQDDATHPGYVGVTGERYLTAQAVSSSEEADSLGRAMLQRRTLGESVVRGIAEGDAALRPGMQVSLSGISSEVSATYALTKVTHRLDRTQGYVCELDSSPAFLITRDVVHSSLGIVIDIDDPDSIGRVRVSYPDLGMLESLWLEVVHPGAGHGKGVVALPDVDDKVLVLFVDGEPSKGVIIGGLYGDVGPPDDGVEGGKVKRYTFVTPGGQQLTLDDKNERVKLQNSDGSFVMFNSDEMRLHSKCNMTIEAPGKALVISADTIDFKHSR